MQTYLQETQTKSRTTRVIITNKTIQSKAKRRRKKLES